MISKLKIRNSFQIAADLSQFHLPPLPPRLCIMQFSKMALLCLFPLLLLLVLCLSTKCPSSSSHYLQTFLEHILCLQNGDKWYHHERVTGNTKSTHQSTYTKPGAYWLLSKYRETQQAPLVLFNAEKLKYFQTPKPASFQLSLMR